MKRILKIACFILLLSLFASVVTAEPPEPTTATIKYECQILWGTLTTTSVWTAQPITYSVVTGTAVTTHKYTSNLGVQKWEANVVDFDPVNPQKVELEFTISVLPSNKVINFYRLQIRSYVEDAGERVTEGPWSDISDWVVIYKLSKPTKPIHKVIM